MKDLIFDNAKLIYIGNFFNNTSVSNKESSNVFKRSNIKVRSNKVLNNSSKTFSKTQIKTPIELEKLKINKDEIENNFIACKYEDPKINIDFKKTELNLINYKSADSSNTNFENKKPRVRLYSANSKIKHKKIKEAKINFNKNERYLQHEHNILYDKFSDVVRKSESKPLLNTVLNIEFSDEDKKEFSPNPNKNKKLKQIQTNKNNLIKKCRPNTASYVSNTNQSKFKFREDNFTGDKLDNEIQVVDSFDATDDNIKEASNCDSKLNSTINEKAISFSSNNIIDTIKLISKNPTQFKHTNKIFKDLGELSKNNMHIIMDNEKDKLNMQAAIKEFEKSNEERQKLLEYSKQIEGTINQNDNEIYRKKYTGNKSFNKESKLKNLINSVKDESKLNKSIEIQKKTIRDFLNGKKLCINKKIMVKCSIKSPKTDIKDELLKTSDLVIKESSTARKIIEGVINKFEDNSLYSDYLQKKAMNGFVLKAYTNLYKKGKTTEIKNNRNIVEKKEDVYDQIYFKDINTKVKNNLNSNKVILHPFIFD